jgi:hypothetical protein
VRAKGILQDGFGNLMGKANDKNKPGSMTGLGWLEIIPVEGLRPGVVAYRLTAAGRKLISQ